MRAQDENSEIFATFFSLVIDGRENPKLNQV
jgi:hypothetical protein